MIVTVTAEVGGGREGYHTKKVLFYFIFFGFYCACGFEIFAAVPLRTLRMLTNCSQSLTQRWLEGSHHVHDSQSNTEKSTGFMHV